jgi:formylglycine-generating enzyme required for sulfatase activity/serine/threonine protein kinase
MTPKQPSPHTPLPPTAPFTTADPAKGNMHSADGTPVRLRLEPGERPLPEYVLVRELGSGGFGQVWLATGPGGFEVALKFLMLGGAAGETELKALQMMKGIRHANLLALFGVWEAGGWLVVAMELADRSLLDRLNEAVKQGHVGIPCEELLDYMRDAARGLDFLADKGVLHRDVKPHNLFLSGNSVKIADYGLAKVLAKTLATASTKMTPAYSAPEFFNGKGSKSSDQYCLAVSYCHLRGNRLPFTGELPTIMAGHLTREPDLSMLPPEERPIVAKAMTKEPGQRWPSCKAFVEALATALNPDTAALHPGLYSADKPPPSPPDHRVKPRMQRSGVRGGQTAPHLSPTAELPPPLPKRPPVPPRSPPSGKRLWLVAAGVAVLLLVGLAVLLLGLAMQPGSRPGPEVALQPTEAKKPDVRPKEKEPAKQPDPLPEKPAEKKPDPSLDKPDEKNPSPQAPKRVRPAFAVAPFSADKAREHQKKWADYLKEPVESVNKIGMKFRLIPPGEFDMGAPTTEAERNPDEHLHRVRLTQPYYMGTTEVTQEQFEKVMNRNPAHFKGSDLPVETITWFDCFEFCNKLSELEGRMPCYRLSNIERENDGSIKNAQVERLTDGTGYRLPTEAEWEYACRGGTTTPFHYGDSLDATLANFNGNLPYGKGVKGEYRQKTTPVGSFQPNALGLYDMHGNVWERCQDYYDEDYYKKGVDVVSDPVNDRMTIRLVLRGGSWTDNSIGCRSADRVMHHPGTRLDNFGFRLVRSVVPRTP